MKILIDLATLRKNPEGGVNKSYVPARSTVSFEFESDQEMELPDFLKPGENCEITSEEFIGHHQKKVSGFLTGPFDSLMQSENLSFKTENEFIEIKTNNPYYLYDFQKINIPCPKCGFVFTDLDQIEDEVLIDSEDNEYPVTICSNCKKIIDLDLEFETVEEALKRQVPITPNTQP
jgi:predicted nucleic-acid-binding Zn-ribbon protein